MNPDLKEEALADPNYERRASRWAFFLGLTLDQKTTRGDSIQVKVELLLQLSQVLGLRWKEMVGISKCCNSMTGRKLCLFQDNITQRPFHTCTVPSFFPIPPFIRTILQLISKHST